MELWCGHLEGQEYNSFPTLADFLLTTEEQLDGDTVAAFKEHLQGFHLQLGRYFPELDAGYEGSEVHSETKNTSNMSAPCVHPERLTALWKSHQMGL